MYDELVNTSWYRTMYMNFVNVWQASEYSPENLKYTFLLQNVR